MLTNFLFEVVILLIYAYAMNVLFSFGGEK